MDKYCTGCCSTKSILEFSKNSSRCKLCKIKASQLWALKNPEKRKQLSLRMYEKHNDSIRARSKATYESDKEAHKKYADQWRRNNPDKRSKICADWQKRNKDKVNFSGATRRAKRKEAIPSWANLEKIAEIYRLAKIEQEIKGEKIHVDHVVPLVSDFVCGLHCESNLQILPAKHNLSKNNKYWPDMWPKENI